MALTFVQGIAIARILGPSNYGAFALIVSFTATINQLVDSRIWETAIKYITRYREEADGTRAASVIKLCYLIDLCTGVIGFLLIYLLADFAAKTFVKDISAANLIRINGVSLLLSIPIGTSSALLRIDNRYNQLAVQSIAVSFARLICVGVTLLLYGGSIVHLVFTYLFIAFVNSVSLFWLGQRLATQMELGGWTRTPLTLLRDHYRHILGFTASTNFNAFLKFFQRNLDILLVGYWFSSTEVGYLRYAKSMTSMLANLTTPLYTTSYPEFVRLWHKEQLGTLRKLFGQLTTAMACFPSRPGNSLVVL